MKIKKVLNNNAIVVFEDGVESVVIGKGIAYNKKSGDFVEASDTRVDKVFTLKNENMNNFQAMMTDLPIEFAEVTNEIIQFAKKILSKELNETIYINLTDHIRFAIERAKDGLTVTNGLLWEIKQFYHQEYEIGLESLNIILNQFGVLLPEDEAGFIALHIINAELNSDMPKLQEMTKIIREIFFIIKYHFKLNLKEDSLEYSRLFTHLKFFTHRMMYNIPQNKTTDEEMLDLISSKYHEAFECTKKISKFIESNYDYQINDDEMIYLTIHINRLVNN